MARMLLLLGLLCTLVSWSEAVTCYDCQGCSPTNSSMKYGCATCVNVTQDWGVDRFCSGGYTSDSCQYLDGGGKKCYCNSEYCNGDVPSTVSPPSRGCYNCSDCKDVDYANSRIYALGCLTCGTFNYNGKVDRMCMSSIRMSGCSYENGFEYCYCNTDYCNDYINDRPITAGASVLTTLSLMPMLIGALLHSHLLQ